MEGISRLPEPIKHRVISFLPTEDAAKTSVLSKAWLSAWQTRPNLDFDDKSFLVKKLKKKRNRDGKTEFFNYVSKCLLKFQENDMSIETLVLKISKILAELKRASLLDIFIQRSIVDRWIEIAVEKGVKRLELVYTSSYPLPRRVFEGKSIEELRVEGSLMQQPPNSWQIQWPHLRKLDLSRVQLGQAMFDYIISCCQSLKILSINRCDGLNELKVINHLKIQQLSICLLDNQNVEVEAPNLEFMDCAMYDKFAGNLSRLNLGSSQNLRSLKLCSLNITDTFSRFPILCIWPHLRKLDFDSVRLGQRMFETIISGCESIEILSIRDCKGVNDFRVIFHLKLKQFSIRLLRNQNVAVEAPNLESLECQNFHNLRSGLSLSSCQNLRTLALHGVEITDSFFFNLESRFPNLRTLRISRCPNLERIKISSHSLEVLKFSHIDLSGHENFELHIDAPNIKFFYYYGNILPQLSFTGVSSRFRPHICIMRFGQVDASWCLKLKEYLSKMIIQCDIHLEFSLEDIAAFNVEGIGEDPVFRVPHVEELCLDLSSSLPQSSDFSSILDGLFWCFRPKIIELRWYPREIEFIKFIFRKLMAKGNHKEKSSQNMKLWSLKKTEKTSVKIWERDLDEVKVKIYGTRTLELPYLTDWKTFLDVSTKNDAECVSFVLQWTTS